MQKLIFQVPEFMRYNSVCYPARALANLCTKLSGSGDTPNNLPSSSLQTRNHDFSSEVQSKVLVVELTDVFN